MFRSFVCACLFGRLVNPKLSWRENVAVEFWNLLLAYELGRICGEGVKVAGFGWWANEAFRVTWQIRLRIGDEKMLGYLLPVSRETHLGIDESLRAYEGAVGRLRSIADGAGRDLAVRTLGLHELLQR